jgi:hypothetical protein
VFAGDVRPTQPPAGSRGEVDIDAQAFALGHGVVEHLEPLGSENVDEPVFLSLDPVDPDHPQVSRFLAENGRLPAEPVSGWRQHARIQPRSGAGA